MYLETFKLPINQEEKIIQSCESRHKYIDNIYPCGIMSENLFSEINFAGVTILYGGNGSGKSTVLNLIAEKLRLNRVSPYNSSDMFNAYVVACKYKMAYDDEGFEQRVPNGSRIITSDDIFDYMLTVRTNNEEIREKEAMADDKWPDLKFSDTIKLKGMEDYEALRLQLLAKRKNISRRGFIRKTAGKEVKLNSNGETAYEYFDTKFKNDTLYCLDEPENSLSPKMQIELVKLLETLSHYCGCQFIIATHSPFILALQGARIYDLDETPVDIKNWWELENTRTYYEFFKKNVKYFER